MKMGAVVNIRRGKNANEPKNTDTEWMRNRAFQILAQLPDDDDDKIAILETAKGIILVTRGLKPA
jgi:hypothetical protein